MIPVGRPQHLGQKTFIIMILRGALPGILLLIIVIILSFFKDSLIQNMTGNLTLVGQAVPAFGSNIMTFIPLLFPVLFFLAMIFGGLGIILSALQYHFFIFTLEEFGIKLKQGILSFEEITIPYRQMQDVDVTRPLIYRLFGLSRLVIFSAGHEESNEPDKTNTVFDPMDCEIAEEIRTILDRRIGVQVIEHETEADQKETAATAHSSPDIT